MNTTGRFSNRAENYVKYRPHYPPELISYLKEKINLNPKWTIADIGSGTGISAELFLKNENTVYGVEPNQPMRESAETAFRTQTKFISINGTAEATTLPNNSMDLILAGQAFHWFDKPKAKIEFQRIIKENGYLLLMWNDRKIEPGFLQAYEDLLIKYGLDYIEVVHRNVDEKALKEFFAPEKCLMHTFKSSQFLDYESLKGRLLSSSYAPLADHPNYKPMIQRLEEIFNEFNEHSKVDFAYNCNLYYGKILKA